MRIPIYIFLTSLLFLCLGVGPSRQDSVPFSTDVAEQLLNYAYAAYCPQNQLQNWTCQWCKDGFYPVAFPYDRRTNTFGYVGVNMTDRTIVVSFRGTQSNSLRNWVIDLFYLHGTVTYKNLTGVEVHKGFYDAYLRLRDQVLYSVQDLAKTYPQYGLVVTGHSLGAALGTLCALDLVTAGLEFPGGVTVINFGDPRVGNAAFAQLFNRWIPNAFRMVNAKDIVPHLPLMSMGFHHVANEIWEHLDEYQTCDNSGEDPLCSDSLRVTLSIFDHLHYMGQYENCDPVAKMADQLLQPQDRQLEETLSHMIFVSKDLDRAREQGKYSVKLGQNHS